MALQTLHEAEFKRITAAKRDCDGDFRWSETIINVALDICLEAHRHQVDKLGNFYWMHPVEIAKQCDGAAEAAIALLHDVLEDTEWSADDLLGRGVPEGIVNSVVLLTKSKGMKNDDYITRLIESNDDFAIRVKLKDIQHNVGRLHLIDDLATRQRLSDKYNRYLELFRNRGVIA